MSTHPARCQGEAFSPPPALLRAFDDNGTKGTAAGTCRKSGGGPAAARLQAGGCSESRSHQPTKDALKTRASPPALNQSEEGARAAGPPKPTEAGVCAQRRGVPGQRGGRAHCVHFPPNFLATAGQGSVAQGVAGGPSAEEQRNKAPVGGGRWDAQHTCPCIQHLPGHSARKRPQQSCLTLTRLCREPESCACLLGPARTPGAPRPQGTDSS